MTISPDPSHSSVGLRGRVLERLLWTLNSLADEMRPIGAGWIVRTRSLPMVWTLNQLRITESAVAADVVSWADTYQGDLPYRHVVVEDDATAHRLESALVAENWKLDREVLMALTALPNREVDTKRVIELAEEEMLGLMRRWITEEHSDIAAGGLDQLEEYNRREGTLWNERCFGVLGGNGDPAAVTKLRYVGSTAWVEDVYTVPEERRRGFARMLVTHATELARSAEHDLTFIIADDHDWPKHLYEAIGFRPIGWTWSFHRAVDRSS